MKFVVSAMLAVSVSWSAQAAEFDSGVHYQVIEPAQPTNDEQKVEVIEVFSYMCPGCASFQPYVHPWSEKLSDQVEFIRMPVVFRPSWEPFARAYYTAEVLGVLDQSHAKIFTALHREGNQMRTTEDIAEFFEQFGVSKADYLKAAKSFGVEAKMKRAANMARRYQIGGTPRLVVNGKYRTGVRMGNMGANEVLKAADFLIAKEMAGLANAAEPESGEEQPELVASPDKEHSD